MIRTMTIAVDKGIYIEKKPMLPASTTPIPPGTIDIAPAIKDKR